MQPILQLAIQLPGRTLHLARESVRAAKLPRPSELQQPALPASKWSESVHTLGL